MPISSTRASTKSASLLDQMKQRRQIQKMLLAGSGAVGKTTLLNVLKHGVLDETVTKYHRTLFFEIESLQMSDLTKENHVGSYQVIDVAGQVDQPVHPFRDAERLAFGGVDLVLLVFSSDDLQSLMDIEKWMGLINDGSSTYQHGAQPQYLLIRNKVDLPDSFDQELVDILLKNMPQIQGYFETSCVTGEGLDELRRWLIDHLMGGK
ncbi:MAG: GTPase domain-containing protein [Candidatus Thorarchaeota archaeon]